MTYATDNRGGRNDRRVVAAAPRVGVILRPDKEFTIGQQVQFAGGSFDGLIATIIEMDEKDRLVVLLDLLKRPVKVKVESTRVIAA